MTAVLATAVASRLWPYLADGALALFLIAGSLWLAYSHGLSVKDAEWQALWEKRNTEDAAAALKASNQARELERARQRTIDQVQADAEKQIDEARTHAADASTAADGLRSQVDKLLAADRARRNTCPGTGSKAAENPGNLLAVVLDQSVARNRELAAIADAARIAGQACERAYDSLSAVRPEPVAE